MSSRVRPRATASAAQRSPQVPDHGGAGVNHQRYAGSDAADVAILRLRQGRIAEARRYFHRCLEYTPRQDYCDYMLALTAQLKEGEPVSPALFD